MRALLVLTIALMSTTFAHNPRSCSLVENTDCEKFVMSHLSKWDYDQESEYNAIRRVCAGNYGDSCLKTITKHLSKFDKNNMEDLSRLAKSCRLTNTDCVKHAFNQLDVQRKNGIEEVTEVANACARTDMVCVKTRCNLREYNCNRIEDLLRASKKCYTKCETRRTAN